MPRKKSSESNILNGLSEDQKIALHFQHIDSVEELKKELAEANSRYRNARKAAKADLGEEGLAEIDEAMRQAMPEGEARAKTAIDRMIRVARWHGSNIGQQLSILDTLPPRDFKAEGKLAGLRGLAGRPPDGLGQADAQLWLEGYHDGQAVLAEGFGRKPGAEGDAEQQASVAAATQQAEAAASGKKKRGRPRKDRTPANDDNREFRPPYARPENQDPNAGLPAGDGDEQPAIGTEPATTTVVH